MSLLLWGSPLRPYIKAAKMGTYVYVFIHLVCLKAQNIPPVFLCHIDILVNQQHISLGGAIK